jgi:hypothetical protein
MHARTRRFSIRAMAKASAALAGSSAPFMNSFPAQTTLARSENHHLWALALSSVQPEGIARAHGVGV